MAAATSPAPPPFSYAQAAKGIPQAPLKPQPQPESSTHPSDATLSEKKSSATEASKPDLPQNTPDDVKSEDTHATQLPKLVRDASATNGSAISTPEQELNPTTKHILTSHSDGKDLIENPLPGNSTAPTVLSSQDSDDTAIPNGTSESSEKPSEDPSAADRPLQATEDAREKLEDDDWVNISTPKVEKELRAAPVPIVNIWKQRIEALEAKTKASSGFSPSTSANTSANTQIRSRAHAHSQPGRGLEASANDDAAKKRSTGRPVEKVDTAAKKKPVDDKKARDEGKRSPREGRAFEPDKDFTRTGRAPPSVGDAASWPTPETANHEERKKPQSQEKAEKIDAKNVAMKPNQKWVSVPYVPTAKFNTPLPLSRRGGRPARGSRDGGSRSGPLLHGMINERPDKMKAPLPGISKQTPEHPRGREQESTIGSRSTSAPTQGPQSAVVGPALADQQEAIQAPASERELSESKSLNAATDPVMATSSAHTSGIENGPIPHRSRPDSRSFSRHSSTPFRMGVHEPGRHIPGESHAHPRAHPGTERKNKYTDPERHTEFLGNRRGRDDSHRDMARFRDFDIKTETWRDRDSQFDRPDHRAGRGRGNYRGRGAHSAYATNQPNQIHAYTAPLPQQPFSNSKSSNYVDRTRQSSAQYAGMPPQLSPRGTSRSQSNPAHALYPGMPGTPGTSLPPLQTEGHGVYGGYPTMYPGIMSAIPYSASMEPMALVSTVSAQVEYYFSIENLCKDMYLRSHMDSQGWVPFSVIAGFNRIKSLTEDMSLIRHVGQISRNIEFRPSEDGNDRLRKLEKWEQWVLDMDQRQPHAQNDGPPPMPKTQSPVHINSNNSVFPSMYQMTSPTWTSGPSYNGTTDAPTHDAAGLLAENQSVDTTTPGNLPEIPAGEDFSLTMPSAQINHSQTDYALDTPGHLAPSQNPVPDGPGPLSNGFAGTSALSPATTHEASDENVFSNERMNELHVCVRHPTDHCEPPFLSANARTFSQGSIDGQAASGSRISNPMPSLRGGAGGIEGLDHMRTRPVASELPPTSGDRGVFWMKDGAPSNGWNREGSTVERYQSLRDRALAERVTGLVTNDMNWLYEFWSHFLVRNFNVDMYHDFYTSAWEDAATGHNSGLDSLNQYYGALLTGQRALTEGLAEDIVRLAENEGNDKRPTFQKLRSAWRNGAFNLKSRKLIDKSISAELKAELEK